MVLDRDLPPKSLLTGLGFEVGMGELGRVGFNLHRKSGVIGETSSQNFEAQVEK